ncbi:MAG: 4Fe-4S ferredoxin [Deltaproteobacteria bacterium HGW-Deltaproteobacteria-12]|nr:MAG: 4Fe-4S ferredoxin [Deltaproteobacteria bacterium HGW-Deltaproteobacteria-12]
MKAARKPSDIAMPSDQLCHIAAEELAPLPPPYEDFNQVTIAALKPEKIKSIESSLDDTVAIGIPKPASKEEEEALVRQFLSGLKKLFEKENNWTFLQPLILSMEHCAKCHTCSEACPVYEMSGRKEIYRPIFRSEVLRRIYRKYIKPGGRITSRLTGNIDLNWTTIARLAELSYRCTLCRRCASVCPIGVDNGLINHEIRKLFSQEMGIAPKELHSKGTVQHLRVGSSTGMNPLAAKDSVEFIQEEMEEITGYKVDIPWDVEGADILLLHNAGEMLAWPENVGAFAIIFQAAGISWTMASEAVGYDAVNYGLWYDDVQFSRVAVKHADIARRLKVKKIVMGECGHAHKALTVIADRLLTGDLNIPRESAMVTLENIVMSGKINFDPVRNNFPVTLHDPCNMVRAMGIVEPQRRILRKIAPRLREMTPHGVENYCCGGGSGFAIMSGYNFAQWRNLVSSRKKFLQILQAFHGEPPEVQKYVCAPCSNCKGSIRDIINYYHAKERSNLNYGGLVELIVNAMSDMKKPIIRFGEEPSWE